MHCLKKYCIKYEFTISFYNFDFNRLSLMSNITFEERKMAFIRSSSSSTVAKGQKQSIKDKKRIYTYIDMCIIEKEWAYKKRSALYETTIMGLDPLDINTEPNTVISKYPEPYAPMQNDVSISMFCLFERESGKNAISRQCKKDKIEQHNK